MIESLLSGFFVIVAVLIGDYFCSLVFGSLKGLKQILSQIILFLFLFNFFMYNILVPELGNNLYLIYFIISFTSIITSRSIIFLLFQGLVEKAFYKRNLFNSKFVKLSKLLNKSMSKQDVIKLFKGSGFNSSFINHLEKVLK